MAEAGAGASTWAGGSQVWNGISGVLTANPMAIAQKMMTARFGSDLFDSKVWGLAGDGCIMEGISSEASSLAGTLGLDNLVVMFDANKVCLDGPIDQVQALEVPTGGADLTHRRVQREPDVVSGQPVVDHQSGQHKQVQVVEPLEFGQLGP